MIVKAGEALALTASRFDLAIWIWKPCNEEERKVKDGAPEVNKLSYCNLQLQNSLTIFPPQITFQVLSQLQKLLKFDM